MTVKKVSDVFIIHIDLHVAVASRPGTWVTLVKQVTEWNAWLEFLTVLQ